jgi:hypothetical protein
MKLGRAAEAQAEFERAAALTRNQRERGLSLRRAREAAAAATAGSAAGTASDAERGQDCSGGGRDQGVVWGRGPG